MKSVVNLAFSLLLLIVGCGSDETNSQVTNEQVTTINPGMHSGEIVEKIDAGSYCYLKLNENDKTYWIAVTQMPIVVGETIHFSRFMEMPNFKSETLNRTFSSVLFVSDASKTQKHMNMSTLHPQTKKNEQEKIIVDKLEGGKTINQIYSGKNSLQGQTIKVRGKVVKFNGRIMDRNWIHVQDGTADGENYDLLVTSNESATVGDIITIEGVVAIDKDFGAGYSYPVLIEKATITKE